MDVIAEDSKEDNFSFCPPLYFQRDIKICDIILKEKVKKVIDLGCGECRLLKHLKMSNKLDNLIGLDIDEDLLTSNCFKLKPLNSDYLNRSLTPLKIELFSGSLVQFDERLKNFDAVIMMEVIEHLHLADLDKFPEILFEKMNPKIIIITTPNSDYNVVFNSPGFRHWDHKFEWSQAEFKDWCSKVANKYNYSYKLDGVGNAPIQFQHIGFCTQIAIFKNLKLSFTFDQCSSHIYDYTGPYKKVFEILYPSYPDMETFKSEVCKECEFFLADIARNRKNVIQENLYNAENYEYSSDKSGSQNSYMSEFFLIKFTDLLKFSQISKKFGNKPEHLKTFLLEGGYKFTEDGINICYELKIYADNNYNLDRENYIEGEYNENTILDFTCRKNDSNEIEEIWD